MTELFDTLAGPDRLASDHMLAALATTGTINRATMNAAMVAGYGDTNASGRWTQRDSFEVLEHSLVRYLTANAKPVVSVDDVRARIELAKALPTQTVRSEDQIDWQQFSTPIDVGALVTLLAQPTATDIVLEPSAGNGLLVAQLPALAELQLNELAKPRRRRLPHAFPRARITGHDGAMLGSRCPWRR